MLLSGCIGFDQVQTDEEFHWYLLRCFATYELRCRDAVDGLLRASGLGDRVDNIWVPTRQVRRNGTLIAINVNKVNVVHPRMYIPSMQTLLCVLEDTDETGGRKQHDDRHQHPSTSSTPFVLVRSVSVFYSIILYCPY